MARIGPVWYLIEGLKLPPKETSLRVAKALKESPSPWEADFLKRMKDQDISIMSSLTEICFYLKSEIIKIYKLIFNVEQEIEFNKAILELFSWKVLIELYGDQAKVEGKSHEEILSSKELVIAQMMLIGFEQFEHGIPENKAGNQLQLKF